MADELKPIETCPNGHRFNTWKYADTCPVCGAKIAKKGKEKTEDELEREKEQRIRERVCGWLVCIKGPNEGLDYRLKAGKNFIGSDPNMDVCIRDDNQIEKNNHAVILCDKKGRESTLIPGDSKGMVYLKNKAVYSPIVLEEMDQIQLGTSDFCFVPFSVPEIEGQNK